MADNNYHPIEVGGIQPIHCPHCKAEVKPLDSFHLSKDNKRYHYPECWHRHELDGDPPAVAEMKSVPPPEEVLDESEHEDESPSRFSLKRKKK